MSSSRISTSSLSSTPPPDNALIAALRETLREHPEVRLALLFGSRARGKAGLGSDVDVAVEGRGLDTLTLAADLSRAAGMEVDVVALEEAGYPLLKAVLRDGVLLHQGAPNAYGSWMSRTVEFLETFRPVWERTRDGFLRRLAEQARS
jgi:predicted nucleotidyltransferase